MRINTEVSRDSSEFTSPSDTFNESPAPGLTQRSSFSSFAIDSPEPTSAGTQDHKDFELQHIVADEIPESIKVSAKPDPFANFQCAWGFQGTVDASTPIPSTKPAFLAAVDAEKTALAWIKGSLTAYIREIYSEKHHIFSAEFLTAESQAAETTVSQLRLIDAHLDDVIREVNDPAEEDAGMTVSDALRIAFGHARPWVQRARQIIVSNHVFYKINYVLAGKAVC